MGAAIKVEGLCKSYSIDHVREAPYETLRDAMANGARTVARKVARSLFRSDTPEVEDGSREEFWALTDVSFEIQQGERVGIIGRNGAGKSTILKILSRITAPTKGRFELRGRVASLLEAGTGFHPELTGRENIFLNGAILGMSKAEIKRKLDEIVAFSEIEKFLDTPVKRYSSGMYVRLAFSVAAHLEPEILIVDEVLAVGDAQFQSKCMGKMQEVGKQGRTILFVSHNMATVKTLCTRAIYLRNGLVALDGTVQQGLAAYMTAPEIVRRREFIESPSGLFRLRIPFLMDADAKPASVFVFGDRIILRFEIDISQPLNDLELGFAVIDSFGQRIFTSQISDDVRFMYKLPLEGSVTIDSEFNLPTLAPGRYTIAFGVQDDQGITTIYSDNEVEFEVSAAAMNKRGASGILWHTSTWRYAEVDKNLPASRSD